ncbi:adenosylcobinamide amidohydrolase [Roseovarius sp. LXJ103]|uniref:adenosylcobinamide amidohydrolase n=1 Tax=Roseovarius carneus TaxID=2853164 RepID=UPI000D61C386|nr:adenosylcobinamide amidohydrolase [Roseovarius carneus]MBZ8118605.1 adenosylcobinamide amidohydrolase [Roseovarius carneus]PWE35707.1 adenosylcobinamide amidohydrolase [Pelagicola sp. LXJ1103]
MNAPAQSRLIEDHPWLAFDLGAPMQVLSWAINAPGFVTARHILWREVRNADLTLDMDVHPWLERQLRARGAADAVCFLTSRDVRHVHQHRARVEGAEAHSVATVGLGNAERVGTRRDKATTDWGTINIAVAVQTGLTQAAMIEAMSIAAQARTAAIIELGVALPTGIATGTGTDCIAIAAPHGAGAYTGLHTALGEAIGAAVYHATKVGGARWIQDTQTKGRPSP